jgi:hypothetical protein
VLPISKYGHDRVNRLDDNEAQVVLPIRADPCRHSMNLPIQSMLSGARVLARSDRPKDPLLAQPQ